MMFFCTFSIYCICLMKDECPLFSGYLAQGDEGCCLAALLTENSDVRTITLAIVKRRK